MLTGLYLIITACSPKPLLPQAHLAERMIDYFNNTLPPALPRFDMIADSAAIFLGGEKGQRSFLLNPENVDQNQFIDDTLWMGRSFGYLTFYDEEEANYNYAASIYSPEDKSRFGPRARLLEISTPALFRKDNPEDSALGYLAVGWHEMAHMTEHFPEPAGIPMMMDQMMAFQNDIPLKEAIHTENELLLSAISAPDPERRRAFIERYLKLKGQRADTTASEVMAAENYYEFNEGYGRFVEHLMQERAAGFQDELLTGTFGAIPTYSLAVHPWMDHIVGNDYYYVLGFNKYRLLAAAGDWSFVESLKGTSNKLLDDYLQELAMK